MVHRVKPVFPGFTSFHWFSSSLPVFVVERFLWSNGPDIGPVPGSTGWSGPIFITLGDGEDEFMSSVGEDNRIGGVGEEEGRK
ncbi:hypothetical protein MTR_1g046040 [Medicago truncatula]|uniref:Uncharacterized protein n=1 Tax=Medicago truncatula TaxID=3880 RepID=G7I796_MEDTR|nr:hypothetical protein MTR_1g046040 [Medicago truncatula]